MLGKYQRVFDGGGELASPYVLVYSINDNGKLCTTKHSSYLNKSAKYDLQDSRVLQLGFVEQHQYSTEPGQCGWIGTTC